MVSRSAWPSIGLWEEEEDAGRGKRFCMGLGSPTEGEKRPALSTTPIGSTNSHNSPSYEAGNNDFVPDFFQTSHRKRDPAGWVSMDGQPSLLMASSQVTRSRAMTHSNPINLLPGLRRKGRITQL